MNETLIQTDNIVESKNAGIIKL